MAKAKSKAKAPKAEVSKKELKAETAKTKTPKAENAKTKKGTHGEAFIRKKTCTLYSESEWERKAGDVFREMATVQLKIVHVRALARQRGKKTDEDKVGETEINELSSNSDDDAKVSAAENEGLGDTRTMTRQQRCPCLQVMHRHISSERERECSEVVRFVFRASREYL